MKTSKKTILITGGITGIGLVLAKLLAELGNKVIITGKNKIELCRISKTHKNIYSMFCDLACEKEVEKMISKIHKKFPHLNVFINNAGQSYFESVDYLSTQCSECLLSQYLSGIWVTEELLPLFEKQQKATIIDASLLTISIMQSNILLTAIQNITESYNRLLRHKLRYSKIDVPDLLAHISIEQNTSPTMIALRIIEAIYNKNSSLTIFPGNEYRLVNTVHLSRNILNNQITN